ncbi:Exosortase [Flavobacterium sp. 9AF]|uniref:polysaccharide pyruvyl transferase family protein n=1 Tax=Flavobacterium sp. 9AF TaxID=2653142 RepID=UPI0012F1AE83|nr:polysaccharide pyruvyl transferase family protein [Flavobacterium sp. 9AF]VXC31340.1 Exosortase [Flavobacterium sp. 9AF]
MSNQPRVYWWSMIYEKKSNVENFGDYLTPYLVEKLTGKKPILFSPKSKFARFFKHSLMVGSIISRSNNKTLVWGSGIIKKDDQIKGGNFLLVRGPKTRKRLEELGLKFTTRYGDPAIILPKLYSPKIEKKYEIGIIPHFFHYEELISNYKNDGSVFFINLLTNDIEEVIKQILSCKKIISTSLHGVIVSHTYKIPAIWWKYAHLNGDDIKFYDYFESVNLNVTNNYQQYSLEEVIKIADYYLPEDEIVMQVRKDILETFPYKIKKLNFEL